MPKEKSSLHTAASIEHVALQLEAVVAQLRVAKDQMTLAPALDEVSIPREPARELGLQRISSWADAVRDAVSNARLNRLRTVNGVASAAVSDSESKRKKAR